MKQIKLLLAFGLLSVGVAYAQPTFQNGEDPKPAGKKWEKIENMSDEFNGNSLDLTKWAKSDPQWAGRVPGKFKEQTISVSGGELKITNYLLPNREGNYTHGCGMVRGVHKNTYGYYETKMKANKTFLSSTFWLFNKRNEGSGCDVRTTELDITETVGFNSNGANWVNNMINSMNSNSHSRGTTCPSTPVGQNKAKAPLGEPSWKNYHVYGVWWKSKNELIFFLDGKRQQTIAPPADFNLPMYLRMVTETYDWNPVPNDPQRGMGGSVADRTTYYQWTRSWRLVDDNNPPPPTPTASVNCDVLPSVLVSGTSIEIPVAYTADQSRDVVVEVWNSGWLGQGTKTVNAGSGTTTVTVNLATAPSAGTNYLLKASIRPIGTGWQQNIDSCSKNNVSITTGGPSQNPYGGTARNIPGTIEAEDFDTGGQGVAYNDNDVTNNGPNIAREDEGVDIEARDGGKNVGWTGNGEWLEYTVNATEGSYDLEARIATTTSGKSIVAKLDGIVLGTFNLPNTGSWGSFRTIKIENVSVTGGNSKVLRLEFVGGGVNLNWVKFSANTAPANPVTTTLSPINDAYLQGNSNQNNTLIRTEAGNRVGYLMFDLSGINGTISSAQLKMTCVSDPGNGNINVHLGATNGWTETNLTNNNKPSAGALLGNLNNGYSIGTTYSWDLNSASIIGGGSRSFIITHTGGNDVAFASKENSAAAPQLVITYTPSTSRATTTKEELDAAIYNNSLFGSDFQLELKGNTDKIAVHVYDMNKRLVYKTITTKESIKFDSNLILSKGLHFFKVSNLKTGKTKTLKYIVH